MPALLRRAGALVVTGGSLWAVALLSEVPYAARSSDAELRLSWRLRSEPEQACRRRTPDELARLPAHMRDEEVCERRMAPYRLRVTVGDTVLVERLVVAAGARSDRPLFVFARFPVTPGTYPVRVAFAREGAARADSTRAMISGTDAPTHRPAPAAPPRLTLDTILRFPQAGVLAIVYDEDRQRLRVVGGR